MEKMKKIVLVLSVLVASAKATDPKDFDDSVLYKIDIGVPSLKIEPENQLYTVYTQEKEKIICQIPKLKTPKEEEKPSDAELSPIAVLQPIFSAPTCSFRIEAYWSYEICHGHHVRQYHEEREGKNVKFQEYYLGKWNEYNTEMVKKEWENDRKSGVKPKYKKLKIDNTKYPYFEMEFTDGTMCDIINAPRTTMVRYVCYPHGKDDIYSFKETSSCNYEAIILTSSLCAIPAFQPEEAKEIVIDCVNERAGNMRPVSMLRQELSEGEESVYDLLISKDTKIPSKLLPETGDMFKNTVDVEKLFLELIASADINGDNEYQQQLLSLIAASSTPAPLNDLTPIKDLISGKNCLTGGTGWWKYEFCYGRYVRQFHKDMNNEVELFLGYFSEEAHRQWASSNSYKRARRPGLTSSIWHHYEKGTICDGSGLPREVDVKLTCIPVTMVSTAVSMYLLEPKPCQYILVVESPIICDLIPYADESGLVTAENLQKFLTTEKPVASTPTTGLNADSEEQIRS